MEGWLLLTLVFGIIFCLLFIGIPIAFCMLTGGIVGLWLLGGSKLFEMFLGYSFHHLTASYPLAVTPMFILVGTLAEAAGLGDRSYSAFHKFLGNLRGGLLMATTGAAAVFGACCGSSVASAGLFSRVAIPELRKLGYQEALSFGCIATAGSLAVLIPPSVMVVFYGILTNVSIGKVLIAGLIPGAGLSLLIMLAIYVRTRINPKLAPRADHVATIQEKVISVLRIWPLLAVFLVIVGGIYTGLCTPTEAGAIGSAVVLVYAIVNRVGMRQIWNAFYEAAVITAQIFILIIGGQIISKVVSLSGVTNSIVSLITGHDLSLFLVWVIFISIYIILGAILDPVSMLVLTLPVIFPILKELGVDPVALGVIVVLLVEVAVLTPPIGFNVYVVSGIANVDPVVVFRGSVMFFFVILGMIIIVIMFPSLATFLPNLAFR